MFLDESERRSGSAVPPPGAAGQIERFDIPGIPPDAVPRGVEGARAGSPDQVDADATPIPMKNRPRHKNAGGDENAVQNGVEHSPDLCRNDAGLPTLKLSGLSR